MFNIFWAFYLRAWPVLSVLLIGLSLLYFGWSMDIISAQFCLTIVLALGILLGFHASDFHCYLLEQKGFVMNAIIIERNREAAEALFFSREMSDS